MEECCCCLVVDDDGKNELFSGNERIVVVFWETGRKRISVGDRIEWISTNGGSQLMVGQQSAFLTGVDTQFGVSGSRLFVFAARPIHSRTQCGSSIGFDKHHSVSRLKMHPLTLSAPPLSPEPNVNPDLYRVLNDVIPLDECEVYSWFPEPEYDPHLEDGESEFEVQEEVEDETPASWGQAGMDLDDVPESVPMAREDSTSGQELGSAERSPGLLWSLNYFFYSK